HARRAVGARADVPDWRPAVRRPSLCTAGSARARTEPRRADRLGVWRTCSRVSCGRLRSVGRSVMLGRARVGVASECPAGCRSARSGGKPWPRPRGRTHRPAARCWARTDPLLGDRWLRFIWTDLAQRHECQVAAEESLPVIALASHEIDGRPTTLACSLDSWSESALRSNNRNPIKSDADEANFNLAPQTGHIPSSNSIS